MASAEPAQTESRNDSTPGNLNRVWVGNLAYKSSEQDLRDAFTGMKISEVSLPERFGRRQGYAFITFEDPLDVEKALAEVNGKELLGREMRVQKATSGGPYTSENGDGENTSGEIRKLRPKLRAKRPPRRTPAAGTDGRTADTEASNEDAPEKDLKPRRRTQKKASEDEDVSEGADGSGEPANIGRRRPERKGPPEDGTPSTTTIYVSNIPFEYTDDKLKELFVNYKPMSAYIVPRQIPRFVIRKLAKRGEARKGRGFGFVTFEDEAAQKRAVDEMNGCEVENRAISVKVAIDKPREEKENGDDSAADVTANGSS